MDFLIAIFQELKDRPASLSLTLLMLNCMLGHGKQFVVCIDCIGELPADEIDQEMK